MIRTCISCACDLSPLAAQRVIVPRTRPLPLRTHDLISRVLLGRGKGKEPSFGKVNGAEARHRPDNGLGWVADLMFRRAALFPVRASLHAR
jgi:hypothetical protein